MISEAIEFFTLHLKNKKFVLFARYVNPAQNPRKGIKEMVAALILFCKDKNKEELASMCLMLAGVPCEDMYGKLPITRCV